MLHILLLTVFTAGVATFTFALMGLASLAGAGYRSSTLRLARSPSVANDGMPLPCGSGTSPAARRGNRPGRS
jgi:hypothetical protein